MARSRADTTLLFATRITRLFAYGFLSVSLVLYLAQVGLSEQKIGLLLTSALAGDAAISLWITTSADRVGRRRMLILGAVLMVLAGVVFALTSNPILLIAAAVVGVISPSGNEIGPFLSIEQASLSHLVSDARRTHVFAWYNLVGSFATALGALVGGQLAGGLQRAGFTLLESYRAVLIGYAICGAVLALLFLRLSRSVEISDPARGRSGRSTKSVLGLHRSRNVVLKLSALFSVDAFGGGLVVQSIVAYWFHVKFGVGIGVLGGIFFGANMLAGVSALFAAKIAARIGLINTMVFTHIPSNIFLALVPLMPTLPLAIGLLLLRFSISQMDVPTRQSYTMAVVSPDERSAASGVTTIARSVGSSLSPALSGVFLANPLLMNMPFYLAGGLKVIYDLLLYGSFRRIRPSGEAGRVTAEQVVGSVQQGSLK
jgi:MFS family permease